MESWQVRLLISVALGSVLGFERFLVRKPAGLRTVTLVTVGSTIMMMIADRMQLAAGTPMPADTSRIAQGVITGVGFLGAGTILRHQGTVYGLTTAAVIWLAAAVGMAAGSGFIDLAIWGTALSLIVLQVYGRLEFWMRQKNIRAADLKMVGAKDPDAL